MHPRLCARVAGVMLWAARPLPGPTLFLSGLYFHERHPRGRFGGFLSDSTFRGLADLVGLVAGGWSARASPSRVGTLFMDAGSLPSGARQVGVFHPTLGVQMHSVPPVVRTQQEAESYAAEYALRVAISTSPAGVCVVGDNLGVLFNLISLNPRVSNYVMVRIFRRIFNRLF